MASVGKLVLLASTALTATRTGDSVSPVARSGNFVAFLKAPAVNGSTTVAAKIQHSPNGIDWFDYVSFTSLVGVVGSEIKQMDNTVNSLLPNVRAVVTLTGGTGATVEVSLFFEP